jgi:hypothetical protein
MNGTAPDDVIQDQLSDDTLVVFLSDAHIGGPTGSDIFESAAELTALLRDLSRHQGPLELVLAGDFFDLLRMEDPGRGEDGVTATIARPEYQELFAALGAFAVAPERPPPLAGTILPLGIAVFVSGHTHAPAISTLTRPDGTQTVIVNTGCWLRQLQPVEAWLGVPPVWVPAFVLSHVRVRSGHGGVVVELWEHPKPAERRLPWIERVAIAGRMPPQPPRNAEPRLVARRVAGRRRVLQRHPALARPARRDRRKADAARTSTHPG